MSAVFQEKLARLKRKNPGHSILPVIEEMGVCALSLMYIDIALQEDPVVISPEEEIKVYYKQNDKLYSQRAVHSNKFHDCTSDNERAELSIAIGSIQAEIIRVRQIIDAYKETGVLPKNTKKLNMVMDGRRKEKKLLSVRSSISYFKGQLRKATDPDKIKEYEHELERLKSLARELAA